MTDMHQRRTHRDGETTPQRKSEEPTSRPTPAYKRLRRDADSPDELDVPDTAVYFGTDGDGNVHYFSWARWRVFEVDDETVVGVHSIEPGDLDVFVRAVSDGVGWTDVRYSGPAGLFRHLEGL